MTRPVGVAVLIVLVCAPAPVAIADDEPEPLARARLAVDALQYERAAALVEDALRSGQNRPETLIEIHRLAGEIAIITGDELAAERHFAALCEIDRTARYPEGTSPKITEAHARACARVERVPRVPAPTAIARPSATIARPAVALAEPRAGRRPLFARPLPYAALAGAAAISSTAFGLNTRRLQQQLDQLNAASSSQDFRAARHVESRLRRSQLVTNLSLGVTGASALAAAILLVIDRRTTRPRARLIPESAGAIAGVSLELEL